MNYLEIAAQKSENAYIVIWRDPSEGDGAWKDKFDGDAKLIMDCCFVEETPKHWILYRTKCLEDDEKGAEIYIPRGCIVKMFKLHDYIKEAVLSGTIT